jgi:hypothetical protein
MVRFFLQVFIFSFQAASIRALPISTVTSGWFDRMQTRIRRNHKPTLNSTICSEFERYDNLEHDTYYKGKILLKDGRNTQHYLDLKSYWATICF